jgi:hypothetical protein
MLAGTKFCVFGPICKKYQTLIPTKTSHLKVHTIHVLLNSLYILLCMHSILLASPPPATENVTFNVTAVHVPATTAMTSTMTAATKGFTGLTPENQRSCE